MSQLDLLQIANKVFSEANVYHKARSGYKLEAVQMFLDKLGFPKVRHNPERNGDEQPITLLEVAAGTGQFTKVLFEAIEGTDIQRYITSEPVESMRKAHKENNPGVELMSFRAEKIPLPDASVHAIVAANAIHYFSTPEAYAEICRVLVPGGVIGVYSKAPDVDTEPWVLEILKDSATWYQHADVSYDVDDKGEDFVGWGPALIALGLFHEVHSATALEYDPMNEQEALDHFSSFGAFGVCSQAQKDELMERYKKVIFDNYSGAGRKMTELPFKSFMYWAKKK